MSSALSDYNKTGVRAQPVARTALYSDINLTFQVHPILKDIRPVTDLEAVKNSVRNLVLTNHFERPFQPELGGNITRLLFEPSNVFTAISIQQEIQQVLSKYEPRITDLNVEVYDDSDRNRYEVVISYRVTFKAQAADSISFYLNRLR